MYIHICIHIYLQLHTYIYIYTHIYTCFIAQIWFWMRKNQIQHPGKVPVTPEVQSSSKLLFILWCGAWAWPCTSSGKISQFLFGWRPACFGFWMRISSKGFCPSKMSRQIPTESGLVNEFFFLASTLEARFEVSFEQSMRRPCACAHDRMRVAHLLWLHDVPCVTTIHNKAITAAPIPSVNST